MSHFAKPGNGSDEQGQQAATHSAADPDNIRSLTIRRRENDPGNSLRGIGVVTEELCGPDRQPANAGLFVEPDPKSVAGTRRFTQQRVAALGADEEAQATATLLVSELMTNVVMHARTSALVDVTERGDCICVSVTDGSPLRPLLRSLQPDEVSGRGTRLVKDLAASYGVERDDAVAPGGKRVWFAIAKATPAVPVVNGNARWTGILDSLSDLVVGTRTAPLGRRELPKLVEPAGP